VPAPTVWLTTSVVICVVMVLATCCETVALTVSAIDPDSGALADVAQYPMGQMPNWVEIVDLH
jgi:hypothetical protein